MVAKDQKKAGSKKPVQAEASYSTYPSTGSSKRK